MKDRIEIIIKKVLKKDIILYVVFGVLTTIVNIATFWLLTNLLKWEENISNFIAIILAILLAYFTNRVWVFHSEAEGVKEKINEFVRFISGRIVTMIIEFVGCSILFETSIPTMISKTAITIIVIILNFFISKFFAFKTTKKEEKGEAEK